MKNLHLIPTDKPSRLYEGNLGELVIIQYKTPLKPLHIYITNNEEIKEGVNQWYLDSVLNEPYNSGGAQYSSKQNVIILTTDQDLIKDGVQAIDDEFLEWFVKNPSCEEVDLDTFSLGNKILFNVVFPKEEPNQETSKVTRVEVIQHSPPYNGRAYTNYNAKDVEIQFQDDGKTLKIFLK